LYIRGVIPCGYDRLGRSGIEPSSARNHFWNNQSGLVLCHLAGNDRRVLIFEVLKDGRWCSEQGRRIYLPDKGIWLLLLLLIGNTGDAGLLGTGWFHRKWQSSLCLRWEDGCLSVLKYLLKLHDYLVITW
jgi:hypothetical protein